MLKFCIIYTHLIINYSNEISTGLVLYVRSASQTALTNLFCEISNSLVTFLFEIRVDKAKKVTSPALYSGIC